ncbi:BtpA/SgcQ family protein [Thermococcus sp. GR7]|uniref:BtpA/SgcQ family protein n=1 Tax=unclassified Thermococcus TaxID=2627626 RepID=UPI00142F8F83|nr:MULTISPECIES: BtpA/SgcQ family protein [unclassified Thermococcus]NJE43284.1 BtpA/SgcQ family protein [Thermococcus sp. GR6]NJE46725.1 BtpA/SgcQ family protein [Thermococcus sp. GR7]NJE77847.1 BtpA/SgcQ family protein [Thermococcus sp. GR4]NJF22975.1 BtpA/SgcQ family protein [Thermococcus sp. GR5]
MDFEKKLLIGMVHLKPLPGSYLYDGDFDSLIERAIADARTIEEAGFDAIMVENFGDVPFPKYVDKTTVASLAVVARAIREEVSIPLGINVLRNDGVAAYSIAYAVKADFIRVNVLSGVAYTDQGIIEGIAHELARIKKLLPSKIKVFADVHVKHAVHFGDFEDALLDTVERGLADAVVVSGRATGKPVDLEKLALAKKISPVPVVVGSGTSYDNLPLLWKHADGFIIGTWIKRGGKVENEVSLERARKLVELVKNLRESLF